MTKGYVRDATLDDLGPLTEKLRAADVAELKASSGQEPGEVIRTGILIGAKVACLPDGTPAAIFGVTPAHDPDLGFIWMVATTDFHLLHRQFIRECRSGVDELAKGYRLVMNFTDARNHVHHRWLQWAGFTIIRRHEEWGHERRPFLEFVKITEAIHV